MPRAMALDLPIMGRKLISLIAGAVGACALGAALVTAGALAQTHPAPPINIIVAFPPGGNTDIMARALQNENARALGQTGVVINQTGAARTLRLLQLSPAAADRFT